MLNTNSAPSRLTALDIFRGATMAFMVLVNNPGDGDHSFAPLRHAHWNGWTPTDVVFPSFVWITGLAMTLALGRKLEKGASKTGLLKQAARRAAILFLLGLIVYSFPVPDPATFRILGVLQRIAICYFISAAIYLYTSIRGQALWALGLLVVYWLLMAFAPVPGYGSGRLDVEGNFAHYIDHIVLGSHNYANTKTWDPEGLVSTLPSIASCLLGILAGHVLASPWSIAKRAGTLIAAGAVMIALAYAGDPLLPINKSIWTSTFALLMAGLDCVMFGSLLWLADRVEAIEKLAKPFILVGMNAITIYMSSEIVDIILTKTPMGGSSLRQNIYQALFRNLSDNPDLSSLYYALTFTGLHVLLAWVLYRKGWFIRV